MWCDVSSVTFLFSVYSFKKGLSKGRCARSVDFGDGLV